MSKYNDVESLNTMVRGGEDAPMVFITPSYLEEVLRTQAVLPSRALLPEHAVFRGTIDDTVLVVALSYCWCEATHPDPKNLVLEEVVHILRFLHLSRHFGGEEGGGLQDRRLAVFWDWLSLYQSPRSPDQKSSFDKGLSMVNVLYAHTEVLVFLCTRAHRSQGYLDSGWPYFEWSVSQFVKRSDLIIDVPTARRFIETTVNEPDENRTMARLHEVCRPVTRRLAASPEFFNDALKAKKVTNGSDKGVLEKKYRETFTDVMDAQRTEVELRDVRMATTRRSAPQCSFSLILVANGTKLQQPDGLSRLAVSPSP